MLFAAKVACYTHSLWVVLFSLREVTVNRMHEELNRVGSLLARTGVALLNFRGDQLFGFGKG